VAGRRKKRKKLPTAFEEQEKMIRSFMIEA
jgi:hypothetical protein